jgi:hypothetical protein
LNSQSGDVNTSGDEKISESGEESEEHDDGSPVADQRGDQVKLMKDKSKIIREAMSIEIQTY